MLMDITWANYLSPATIKEKWLPDRRSVCAEWWRRWPGKRRRSSALRRSWGSGCPWRWRWGCCCAECIQDWRPMTWPRSAAPCLSCSGFGKSWNNRSICEVKIENRKNFWSQLLRNQLSILKAEMKGSGLSHNCDQSKKMLRSQTTKGWDYFS